MGWTSATWRRDSMRRRGWARELAEHLGPIAAGERERFIEATSLDAARYGERFSSRRTPSLDGVAGVGGE